MPIAWQSQIEQALDSQAELDHRLAVLMTAARLPLALPCQHMTSSSQMSTEPRAFSAV